MRTRTSPRGCGVQHQRHADEALALARQRAGADHQFTPELAPFPEAVVGRGVAEAQKNGQRQADQRERDGRDGDLEIEQIAMCVGDQHGQHDVQAQHPSDALQHGTAQDEEKVEAGGAVADDHAQQAIEGKHLLHHRTDGRFGKC
jgi:hypothetical protein